MSGMSVIKHDPVERALDEAVKKFTYGAIIEKEWLMDMFELTYPKSGSREDYNKVSFEYMALIESFKEAMLADHKMMLVAMRGVGYKIVKPSEQTRLTMIEMSANIRKELKKGRERLLNVNTSYLTSIEDKERTDALGRLATIEAFTKRKLPARVGGVYKSFMT